MRPRNLWWAVLIAAVLAFTVAESLTTSAFDFRAFYCAGAVVREHANPYRTEPLHSCQQTRTDGYYAAFSRAVALPAPLPGYDFALFAPLSQLSFSAAKAVWNVILVAAIAVAIIALVRLSGLPTLTVFVALWLCLVYPSIEYGEIIPIAIAAICLAAVFARQNRWTAAAVAAAVAMVEPHLGLPVCVVLALWAPRTRITLAVCGLVLAILAWATLGLAQNVEYFRTVLPLHALSELGSDAQLSVSVLLHYLGFGDILAVRLGGLWYLAMIVTAAFASRALVRSFSDRAFFVTVPAAFAVVGGAFIHVTDMVAAVPLAMLAYKRFPQHRPAISLALILLALPWWHLALLVHQQQFALIPMTAAVGLYLGWQLSGGDARFGLGTCIAVLIALLGINGWYVRSSDAYHRTAPAVHITMDRSYPEASWAWTNAKFISTGVPASWALRGLTWLGLVVTIGAVVVPLRRARAVTQNSVVKGQTGKQQALDPGRTT